MAKRLERFETEIGYKFQDTKLLRQALTHSSYANERRINKQENNERLEFLGDAVLELTTSEYVFKADKKFDRWWCGP